MKPLQQLASEHILVAAHRGVSGGNIPCNTLPAYKTALLQGADIIEIDVDQSADGQLFIFHPGQERPHLGYCGHVRKLPFSEIQRLRYINQDDTLTQFSLYTLDEIFEAFKGKCYINVDKFFDHPEAIAKKIREHHMADQVIIKCSADVARLDEVERYASEIPFMPIIHDPQKMDEVLARPIHCVGAEILFSTENSTFTQQDFIDRMHEKKLLLWVNAIIYNYQDQLVAGHSDDFSITDNPNGGWGWLADKGYDIIQTDWTMMMIDYLKKSGKYFR